jgi:MFS family permease
VGRTRFLLLSYAASAVGLVLLALANTLWHFWVAVVVSSLGVAVATALGPALVADLVPRDALGRGMGLYNITGCIGAVIGFAGTGHAVEGVGMLPTLVASAVLPLISIALLLPVHRARSAVSLGTEGA